MSPEQLNTVLLLGALVVMAAIGAVRLAHRVGLPGLLVYLGLGLALGEAGLGVRFDDTTLAQNLGFVALVLILAEGGLTTSWPRVRPAIGAALVLATVGVAVSVGVTAAAVRFTLDVPWRLALLFGAVLASTDAAAVFSVLRRLPLTPRLVGILEAESGFNDAPAVIAVALLSQPTPHLARPLAIVGLVTYELAVGAAIGLVVGWLGALALRRVALPASGLYPVAVMSLIVGAYAAGALAHASGFLAVYLAALVLGNARLPHRPATRGFAEGVAWLAQIGLFVMLGLLANPRRLPGEMVAALVAGAALVLLARPASVLVSASPFRIPWREQAFLAWAGLRGAVPIVLATIPVGAGVPQASRVFDQVFLIVVAFTLLQGPTLPLLARRLRVAVPAAPSDLDIEAAPLEELGADLLQIAIPGDSRLHGVEIFELRLPTQAAITLVVREGRAFVPGPTTVLRAGDRLLVVATARVRAQVERRLRAVSRAGRLAGWYGERGT